MRADGVLGDEQPARDLVRPVMLVEQEQHLDLARGEERRDAVRHARAAASCPDLLEEPPCDRPRERGLSVHDTFEEGCDPIGRLGLEQVAGGASANRGEQVFLRARRREDDDLAARRGLAKAGERRQAVETRHQEVEEDDVGLRLGRDRDRLLAVRREPREVEPV